MFLKKIHYRFLSIPKNGGEWGMGIREWGMGNEKILGITLGKVNEKHS